MRRWSSVGSLSARRTRPLARLRETRGPAKWRLKNGAAALMREANEIDSGSGACARQGRGVRRSCSSLGFSLLEGNRRAVQRFARLCSFKWELIGGETSFIHVLERSNTEFARRGTGYIANSTSCTPASLSWRGHQGSRAQVDRNLRGYHRRCGQLEHPGRWFYAPLGTACWETYHDAGALSAA